MRNFIGLLLALIISLCLPVAGLCGGLTFYTANVPPYTYADENGTYTGLAIDLDKAILDLAGMPVADKEIRDINWARAYHTVLTTPDTALMSLARTSAREGLFKWVGPLAVVHVGLIARKSSRLFVDRNTELSQYKVCVVRGGAPGENVRRLFGLSKGQLVRVSNAASQVRMLREGRVDMIAQADVVAAMVMRELEFNPEEFEMVHVLARHELHMALNRNVDDDVVGKLQSCLDELKKKDDVGKSRYCEIVTRYSLNGNVDLCAR